MPPLPGFSDNPVRTREDVVAATLALLKPLLPYFSPAKARIQLPVGTAPHFDDGAAQLEGFARPLWAVAALLAGDPTNPEILAIADPWIKGLAIGTDPQHEEYWGDITDLDQRMVEAEIVAYALLQAPRHFWDPLDERCKRNVEAWLRKMNGKEMSTTNWLWFRVTANLALVKVCGVDMDELKSLIAKDLDAMETFVREDGWSSDGIWLTQEEMRLDEGDFEETGLVKPNIHGRQCDYYSGSFAIQFSQLLYSKFAADIDPARATLYRDRARQYGTGFWKYFDASGACVPFGRSLTYRFACAAFFATLGVARVGMAAPADSSGAAKGFLLRHLRWWAKNSQDIFYQDGTLSIGWKYPQMYMSEDYNSPQSVYWCMKSLVVLSLPSEDPFWTEPEAAYPGIYRTSIVHAPRHVICNSLETNHHFLISVGQWLGWPMKATQAKYCKFAYSSAFGFSVPTGPLLEQMALDNSLAFSRDGKQSWTTKWKCNEVTVTPFTMGGETVDSMSVDWYPWADKSVNVRTTVFPPMALWPAWHHRIHVVTLRKPMDSLCVAEGGFAVPKAETNGGRDLKPMGKLDERVTLDSKGHYAMDDGTLTVSSAGASGVKANWKVADRVLVTAGPMKTDSNTNLMHQRTVIPMVQAQFPRGVQTGSTYILATHVFASRKGGSSSRSLMEQWQDVSNMYQDRFRSGLEVSR